LYFRDGKRGGSPPWPAGTTWLYHQAILYPTRAALADALCRVLAAGVPLDGASDHGVSEGVCPAKRVAARVNGSQRWARLSDTKGRAEVRELTQPKWWGLACRRCGRRQRRSSRGLPLIGQELPELTRRCRRQARQHVLEIRSRLDTQPSARGGETDQHRRCLTATR
jgi:hypothetical protein